MSIPLTSLDDLRILLREERLRRRISQSDIPGVGRTTVVGFENGAEGVRAETLFAMMAALGCKVTVEFPEPSPELEVDEEIDLGSIGRASP